jgi:hypothetical protein
MVMVSVPRVQLKRNAEEAENVKALTYEALVGVLGTAPRAAVGDIVLRAEHHARLAVKQAHQLLQQTP